MVLLRENYKSFCVFLIAFVQLFAYTSAGEPISCIICGADNTTCSDAITETLSPCPDDKYIKCFTKLDNGRIVRGCLPPNGSCKAKKRCVSTEAGKNNQIVCKKCDASDKNCAKIEVSDVKYNQVCAEGTKKCFTKVDNEGVVRDCASDDFKCTDENTCKICEGVNCNTGVFSKKGLSCYQCSGANCNNVTANMSKNCEQNEENDECYTIGESDTTMTRGCRSDTKDNKCSTSAEGCVFCNTTDCNNMKFMHDQTLKCHQCTGNTTNGDCAQKQTGSNFKNCEKQIRYNETEFCYTLLDGETVHRGCFYDTDKCVDGGKATCTKCNQTNGCNGNAFESTCIVCRSDADKNCWNNAGDLKGEKCPSPSSCFHGIWHGVAIRGCLVSASPQNQWICEDPKNNQCHICSTPNCNTQKSSGAKTSLSFSMIFIVLTILQSLKKF